MLEEIIKAVNNSDNYTTFFESRTKVIYVPLQEVLEIIKSCQK